MQLVIIGVEPLKRNARKSRRILRNHQHLGGQGPRESDGALGLDDHSTVPIGVDEEPRYTRDR